VLTEKNEFGKSDRHSLRGSWISLSHASLLTSSTNQSRAEDCRPRENQNKRLAVLLGDQAEPATQWESVLAREEKEISWTAIELKSRKSAMRGNNTNRYKTKSDRGLRGLQTRLKNGSFTGGTLGRTEQKSMPKKKNSQEEPSLEKDEFWPCTRICSTKITPEARFTT
jgi:hypothetical protein